MRKLLYPFLLCVSLIACNGIHYGSDKAFTLSDMDYSVLLSMEKEQLDSVIRIGRKHYPSGHDEAFRLGQIEFVYYYHRLDDKRRADSLANELRFCIKDHRDSAIWYIYKYQTKWALEEKDSAFHYVKDAIRLQVWPEVYAHEQLASIYSDRHQPDSAITHYLKAMELDTTRSVFFLNNLVLDALVKVKDTRKALEYLEKARARMGRPDVPYYHLVKGDYWLEMHEPDSAMKHYRIATETGNGFVASQAYERMGMLIQPKKETLSMYQKSLRVYNDLYLSADNRKSTQDFEALKLKNQLNELEVERQKHIILILGLVLLVVTLIGTFVFYLSHRKRVSERNRLIQENLLLKQQEELSVLREKEALLREKDARMREELFKRMNVFEKLSDTEKEKHIQLSDTDWKEIQLMLDSGYDDFTKKLRLQFPMLSEKDINFCCLVKINMSIQSLTDIYCISKNSISRRKLRLKEKIGIEDGTTLDEFLNCI